MNPTQSIRRPFSLLRLCIGLLALAISLSLLPLPGSAQTTPEPTPPNPTLPPRPTLPPTPSEVPPTATEVPPTATPIPPTATPVSPTATPIPPTATSTLPTRATPTATRVAPTGVPPTRLPPSATPRPRRDDDDDDDGGSRAPTPVPQGRITGTVLDQRIGIPVPNIAVQVGDVVVLTDSYGNYERNQLPAGTYLVLLLLTPEQGTPLQEPLVLVLAENATVVQHLLFTSPPAATATSLPVPPDSTPVKTTIPPKPTPQTISGPPMVLPPPPIPMPAELPATGGELPGNSVIFLRLLGSILLAAGLLLTYRLHRHRSRPDPLQD